MTKTQNLFMSISATVALFAFVVAIPALATNSVTAWDTTGDYTVAMEYKGSDNHHDMTLTQDMSGNLTGNGGSPAGNNTYLWNINSGTVSANTIVFTADYTATQDAVDPQTTIVMEGVIANDGSMSGTWSDNYRDSHRSGTWNTVAGAAEKVTKHPVNDSKTVTVTIDKFIDGVMATNATANGTSFPMTAAFNASNTGASSGTYTLSSDNTIPYRAVTSKMTKGANYSTKEVLNTEKVGASCTENKPFALQGYTTGATHAAAMAATPTMTYPSFINLKHDTFVIVWNTDCAQAEGGLNGEVVGVDGILEVTSIEMIKTTAIANGTFADGWKYVFHITAPTSEPNIAMKFSNWMHTNGSGTIPVASNMRISSQQADNNGATILLNAANTYSTPYLNMTGDLDSNKDGRQVQITVEVAVPNGTSNGSYTTSYGVRSNQ